MYDLYECIVANAILVELPTILGGQKIDFKIDEDDNWRK